MILGDDICNMHDEETSDREHQRTVYLIIYTVFMDRCCE